MRQDAGALTGRRMVRVLDGALDTGVLILILLLAAFSLFAMWDAEQVRRTADPRQFEIYRPTEVDTASFEELRAINPDVFSWLTVYGTNINYPVVRGEDNEKYVNTNVYGKYSLSGSIFLDADNDRSFRDFNSILYGHHMEKSVMFGDIGRFSDEAYFEERRYGNLFFDGRDHGLEFFVFAHTTAYNRTLFTAGITTKASQQQYLDLLYENAVNVRDIGVTTDDRIVLLTTCSRESTSGRDILAARLTDHTFEDTFYEVQDPGETLPYPFDQLYKYRACILALMLILLLLAIAIYVLSQREQGKVQDGEFEKHNK